MKRNQLISECKQIKQNCEYTAEAHHIIAGSCKRMATLFQLIPAIVAALSGLLVAGQVIPVWWAWLTTLSAVVAAVGSTLNPLKDYYDHLNAAKNFTIIKHDARALHETFESGMSDSEFSISVKNLHDRYNDLLKFVPATNDNAFEAAREKIKRGIHKPDKE
jgi:hypothetical protein